MLEQCKICFYTIMPNCYGSLQAVDRHTHSVRDDMAVNRGTCGVSDASSGHLRHSSDANTINQCLSRANDTSIPSWQTLMGHFKLLIAIFTA
eukprot:scaffold38440_cov239-Skeletonema_dohrnii-CCMP3373.AAC.1